MANAAIAWSNLADLGTVVSSGAELLMPIARVLDPHVQVRFRSRSPVGYIIADLGESKSIDSVALLGMTTSAAATARVRLSTVDSSGAAGDAADSGVLADGGTYFDRNYGGLVYLLSAAVSCRYVRIDIDDGGQSYFEAGRLFAGARTQFEVNFSYGAERGRIDRSRTRETVGGQTLVWLDNGRRTIDVRFGTISESERWGFVETIDRDNGRHSDLLFIVDPESDNIARDTVFGLMTEIGPVGQPQYYAVFGKQYRVQERL